MTGGNQIQSVTLQQSGGATTNRITSLNNSGQNFNYGYDAAGNVTNDGVNSYSYDAENRLVSVNAGATATYKYDNQNRRVKKTAGGAATHYVWQGGSVLSEHNASTGAELVRYVYAGSRMIAKVAGGTTSYFISDRLSARLVLTSTSANVAGRQSHLPFGEEIASSGTTDKHKFTSYERDSESGLDYAVNRGYSSIVGRFQQADPYKASGYMVDPQSWNRYAYVHNNPTNAVDPLGLDLKIIAGWICGWFSIPCDTIEYAPPRTPEGGRDGGIVVNPPQRPQDSCNFNLLLTGPPIGGYPNIGRVPDFDPNNTNHGEGTSSDSVPRWFFYYEVLVTIGNLNTRSGWSFNQSTHVPRGYYIIDLGGGRREKVNFPRRDEPDDNPDSNQRQWTFFGYLYFDAPSLATKQLGTDGKLYPVVEASLEFQFEFTAENRISGAKCSKKLTLSLTVTGGIPDWKPK